MKYKIEKLVSTAKLLRELTDGYILHGYLITEIEGADIILQNHTADEAPYILCYFGNYNGISGIGDSIDYAQGALTITFNTIPNITEVNNFVNSFTPLPISRAIFLYDKENNIKTSSGETLIYIQPNEIIVSKNSGQYTSIIDAINYINTLSNKAVVIRVYPGTYIESAPIILPASANIIGEGSAGNTIIYGAHTGAVIITNDFNTIKNFNIVGGTTGILHNGANESAFALVKDCLIKQPASGYAIDVYGGLGSLVLGHVSIYADPITLGTWSGTAMRVTGGSLIMSETIVQAQVVNGIELINSKLTIDITSLYYCQNGISIKNDSQIKGTLVNLVSCYCGINVLANDIGFANSKIAINYLHIDGATVDINADTSATLELYSGHIDTRKIQNKTNLCGIFTSLLSGKLHQTITGETIVDGYIRFGLDIYGFSKYQNYIKLPSHITYFETTNIITAMEYPFQNAGATEGDWTTLNFHREEDEYWLDLHYQPVETTINGQTGLWIRITGDTAGDYESANSIKMQDSEIKFLGNARKEETIYLATGITNFIIPDCADQSTEFEIIIMADAGITIEGEYFAGAEAVKKKRFIPQVKSFGSIQTIAYTATNITMLAIRYYRKCF